MTRQQQAALSRPRCPDCAAFVTPGCGKCGRSPDDAVRRLRALIDRRRTLGQLTMEQAEFADDLLNDLGAA